MKKLLVIGLMGLFLFAAGVASATVITFDDIDATLGDVPVPNGYQGFNWDDFLVLNSALYPTESGYQNGTVSSPNVVYNYPNPALVSDNLFDFNGAYLTAAWNNGLNVEVQGYAGGNLKYDTTVIVGPTVPTYFNFNYLGVDTLEFSSSGGTNAGYDGDGTNFAMDNFTFSRVPEPSTLLLLGSGIAGLAFLRRKNRTAA